MKKALFLEYRRSKTKENSGATLILISFNVVIEAGGNLYALNVIILEI